jgi:endogenous inhibitor of DNA gyrase (YacG/DUF329 family)
MKKCPTCNRQVQWQDNPFRPFCSERCKLVDLGKWVTEEYRVPGKTLPEETVDESEEENRTSSNGSESKL